MGFQAGDQNLYRFVGNDPTNQTDPSGLAERPAVTVSASNVDDVENGIQIIIKSKDPKHRDKISVVQFIKIHAMLSCTYEKSCKGASKYIDNHWHGHGDFIVRTSDPTEPFWNFDNPTAVKTSPESFLFDITPLNSNEAIYEFRDSPTILKEITKEIEGGDFVKSTIQKMQAARPNDGKVTCSVIATAQFQTFILVDGVVASKVSWSIGDGYYAKIGKPTDKPISDVLIKQIKQQYPKYKISNP